MNTLVVWVLVAVITTGHPSGSTIPTLEFSTQEKCEIAKKQIEARSREVDISLTIVRFHGFCQRIEK